MKSHFIKSLPCVKLFDGSHCLKSKVKAWWRAYKWLPNLGLDDLPILSFPTLHRSLPHFKFQPYDCNYRTLNYHGFSHKGLPLWLRR